VIVDFTAFSLGIDRVRCVLVRSFLVLNWCGGRLFLVPLGRRCLSPETLRSHVRSLLPQTIPADVPATGGRSLALCLR
jgi:hypothetical protein